jgi:DNA-binding response OmpR family regulator
MTATFTPATITIVDDEPENLNVLDNMLRQKGWDVRAFPSGELALAASQEAPPDLVLLDIRMPGMNGHEVCRRFKADDRLRPVPIIFLSASSDSTDKIQAFEAGGVDYVTKPFAEIEVLARTETHLRLSRHHLQLEELVRQRVQELAEAHRRLKIWDDAKTQWLNTLSHEMRTPLTGVFGIAELLFRKLPPDSSYHALRKDFDLSRVRIETLINDALTLANIDVTTEDFDMKPLCLVQILQSALKTIAAKGHTIHTRPMLAEAERIMIRGEPELLIRAFTDLLLTASRCVEAGAPITLETRVTAHTAITEIGTCGNPLAPEALETFFDVGGQRDLLTGGGDFGLSSALANRIIRLFNGHISVRNGAERGIVMEITLPTTPPVSEGYAR